MTFPNKVNLYEVGPRDGLQNEKDIIPTEVKINFINKLIDCNFKFIEIHKRSKVFFGRVLPISERNRNIYKKMSSL